MPAATALLVSDIHLPAGRSPYRDALVALLTGPAREADEVFLLGDIFEYWLGDDSGPDYQDILDTLADLHARGVRLYFQAGNRDFLVSRDTLKRIGVELLDDPLTVQLPDGPALLSHGDIWCTQDRSYQRWRRFSRNPAAQALFRAFPRRLRQRIADRMRTHSAHKARIQADAILDVVPEAVDAAFRAHGIDRIIHGHTHRPGRYPHSAGTRIVLPDWRPGSYGYLEATASGLHEREVGA